jgi:hypothetical protein
MSRPDLILAIHAAAVRGDMGECMKLFQTGLISHKVYLQVIKEAKQSTEFQRA